MVQDPSGDIINSRRANGSDYWYRTDHQGSVTNIVDSSDTLAKSYTYDAYGNTSSTGTFINSFAYTGAVIDTETGLYYMNSRYYEPGTGRFISEDTYRGEGEAFWHLYLYCNGDPVNNTDPTGHNSGHYSGEFNIATHVYSYWWALLSPTVIAATARASINVSFDFKWMYTKCKYFWGIPIWTIPRILSIDINTIRVDMHHFNVVYWSTEYKYKPTISKDHVSFKISGTWNVLGSYYIQGIDSVPKKLNCTIYPWYNSKSKVSSN